MGKICLVGYMGSGKSTIGKLLAQRLAYDFQDLDACIVTETGLTIPDIFSAKGELFFRKKETEILQKILRASSNAVLALGGGTPCYGSNIDVIKNNNDTTSVYLKYSVEVLVNRLFQDRASRPLITHLNTKERLSDFLRKHLFERSYYYNQCNLVIDCNHLTPIDILKTIEKRLL